MSFRTTLVLLLVVAGLVGVLVMLDEQPEQKGHVEVPLLDNRLSSAVKIRWQLRDRPLVEIRRKEAGWFELTEPLQDLASISVLRSIGQQYDTANLGETPLEDSPEERKRLGLDPPRATFEVEFEDGSKDEFLLGDDGPLGKDLFVLRDGRIYVGQLGLYSAIVHNIDDLRERMVFRNPPAVASILTLDQRLAAGGRERIVLSRATGNWKLQAPVEARADGGAAEQFVRQLLSLRVDEFAPGVVRPPETEPDFVIEIQGGYVPERVPLWFDEQQNLIGVLEDRGVTFKSYNRSFVKVLQTPLDRLRARVLVAVKDDVHLDLLAMIVDPGEGRDRLRIVRADPNAAWRVEEPVSAIADATAVNELVTALNNLRALQFLEGGADDPAYGLSVTGLRIGYQSTTDRQPQFIWLGNEARFGEFEVCYACRSDARDEVVSVPKGAVDVIRRDWVGYVDRQVLAVKQAPSRLVLERRGGGTLQLGRDEQGDWRVGDGPAREVLFDIVERLRDLRGKRAMLRREVALGDADWTVGIGRLRDDPGQHLALLRVWERGELPLLVLGPANPDVVFELSALDSDALRRLWEQ